MTEIDYTEDRGNLTLPRALERRARQMWRDGEPAREIAHRCGVTTSQMRRIIQSWTAATTAEESPRDAESSRT